MEATKETKFGDEDYAQTLNTYIVQRKRVRPHSTIKKLGELLSMRFFSMGYLSNGDCKETEFGKKVA